MFTRDELLEAVGGALSGGELPVDFPGVAIDSRQVQPGDLFVAMRGESTDGHRFISAAVEHGAGAILCAHPDPDAEALGVPQVAVPDPLAALQEVARRHLARQPWTHVIGVAGSNGKTSAKEAIAALVSQLGPTLKTTGNLNTETGVPVCLLRLLPEHQFAVIEMGAQRVGEVAALCRVAPPRMAVVTVVGPEHLEFFGSLANIIQAEGEIVDALPHDGVAVLNQDDPDVRAMAGRAKARLVSYGRAEGADVRANNVTGDTLTGLGFTLAYQGHEAPVKLHLPGEHAVTTALAAAAVALTLGANLEQVAGGLGALRPAKRRGEIKRGIHGAIVVDDSYNANRQSAVAALHTLGGASVREGGRRYFIFGDMLELGAHSPEEHAAVGRAAATLPGLDGMVLVGADTQYTYEAALAAGMDPEKARYFAAPLDQSERLAAARQAAAEYVRERLGAGDVALVKGSLGVGMDVVVRALLDPAAREPEEAH